MEISQYRICQNCGKEYWVGEQGAGYKYCSRFCAKHAQLKQIAKWESENKMSIEEFRREWHHAKWANEQLRLREV